MKNILISNDDGIQAEGIRALHDAVRPLGNVHVVAPDGERSAISQAITLTHPLYVEPWPDASAPFGLALSGTPADCVKIAVTTLLSTPPDLVLSGINLGPNAGVSVLYSGTVSVATESLILGLPAIAFSLDTFTNPQWNTAARVAARLVEQVLDGTLKIAPDVFWNVNIPNIPYEQLKGLRITRMGDSRFMEKYTEIRDSNGRRCYDMQGDLMELGDPEGTDLQAVRQGYVSLSPIGLNRTHLEAMDTLAAQPPRL